MKPDPARLRQMIDADAYASLLGVRLVADGVDGVVLELEITESHLNFLGVTHGGVIFSLADCAFSLAANAAGDRAVAIDTHLVLSAGSGVGEKLIARAKEVTRGKTLGSYNVTVERQDGRIAGLFTGTVFISR